MSVNASSASFLRKVLLVDAATCAGAGALMSGGAGALAPLMNLPSALLLEAGIALFPVAAFIGFVATRARLSTAAVWIVIVGNSLWIAGSLWVMAGGTVAPNALGQSFVAGQAGAVAVLAFLEYIGVTRVAGLPRAETR
jgi:hypothetical protein